ncbi:MAG: hypothetical protein RR290_01305 [Clostridia bacterium]
MYYDILYKQVEKKLDEYKKIFPEGFPLAQFEGTKKELIEELNKCIKTKKSMTQVFGRNILIMMIKK